MRCLKFNLIKLILVFPLLSATVMAQPPSIDPHWQLVWSDEFNGSNVDSIKWYSSAPWGTCNAESAEAPFNDTCHIVTNGKITLYTKPFDCECFQWEDTGPVEKEQEYLSGNLYSQNAFKYGYFEIRSRFPQTTLSQNGSGLSPTFWMFPIYKIEDVQDFVLYSEIDFYEVDAFNNKYSCNVHYADTIFFSPESANTNHWVFRDELTYINDSIENNTIYDFYVNDGAFHVYSGEWNSQYIRFFYDNRCIRGTMNDNIFSANKLLPMNIIIANSANPKNVSYTINSNTILPYPYEIDYVRVYQLRCDNTTVVNEIPNFNTYNYAVKKSITLSGNTQIPDSTTTCLRATDFIELRSGFEVPMGASLYLATSPCDTCEILSY